MYTDQQLIDIARNAGQAMYGRDATGLLFTPEVTRCTWHQYLINLLGDPEGYPPGWDDCPHGDGFGGVVDTYDYVFFPSTGMGLHNSSDTEMRHSYKDVDDCIYLGGSDGVVVITFAAPHGNG